MAQRGTGLFPPSLKASIVDLQRDVAELSSSPLLSRRPLLVLQKGLRLNTGVTGVLAQSILGA